MNHEIINMVKQNFDLMVSHRRHLHKYPELSFHEFKTSDYVKKVLTELGISWRAVSGTGVVGMIGSGGDCIALRADMDALPIQEETGLDFCSMNDGVMHACGHDFHTSMLLGAAKVLKEKEKKLKGCVKLIFQPGEEKIPGGASLMIKEGVLDNPKPKMIFGQHINPSIETGVISTATGAIMASADELYWTLTGKQAHAAQPHTGNDPIIASAQVITTLQSVISKFRNPLEPAVLTVTSVHGGSATNIIPESVDMMGTLRFFNNKSRNEAHKKIEEISKTISSVYGVESNYHPLMGYPSLKNDESATEIIRKSAYSLFGDDAFKHLEPIMWAEDFAYYAEKIPACFFFLGVKSKNSEPQSLHNSKLSPDENALIYGASIFVSAVLHELLD